MAAVKRQLLYNARQRISALHKLPIYHPRVYSFGSLANLQRNAEFSELTDNDLKYFESVIENSNKNAILSSTISDEDLTSYNTDWLKKYIGKSQLVLKPKTTQEISDILSYCNKRKLAINTQAGNTGLVGGAVPVFDEIILSTSRMNNILSFDEISGILICESGCILQDVDNYLRLINDVEYGAIDEKHKIPHIFPLDLGAKGTCQIGGNIATNAGGLRLVRYGSLHGTVLGLEVVLADGTILDLLSTSRKDNTGYDLKQIFIGAEGTLGIITKASVLCPKWCSSTNLMFVSVNNFNDVLKINELARQDLNEILSAIEFLDDAAIKYPINHLDAKYPLSERNNFYVLIETSGSNFDHDREKLDLFVERLMNEELINDGCIAEDNTQFESIWKLREGVNPGMTESGAGCYKYDVSLPLNNLYDIVTDIDVRLKQFGFDNLDVMGYGHLGDGNLHLNIAVDEYKDEIESCIEPWVYEWVSNVKGSISAEHGIGVMKPNVLHYSKSQQAIKYMKEIKNLFDPNGILQPYKVLPAE